MKHPSGFELLVREMKIRGARSVLREVFKKLFPLWQSLGLHVTPVHFYEPIPDTRTLGEDLWEKESELAGVDLNGPGQFHLLDTFITDFKSECDLIPVEKTQVPYQYYYKNMGFGATDAALLYCMVRSLKPSSVVEVGSGASTCIIAQALLKNREECGQDSDFTVCDPYPTSVVKAGFPGLDRLVARKVQKVPLSEFSRLKENDILFIDSSHVLAIGSDVCYEFLEILPRLKQGVVVHIHDIFFPFEYPREWAMKYYRFWNEQYLLQAFLAFNDAFEVVLSSSYLLAKRTERLEAAFGDRGSKIHPASFWMRKIK